MKGFTAFLDDQPLIAIEDVNEFSVWIRSMLHGDPDVYNKAYLYIRDDPYRRYWYRMDLTPVLIEDVPKPIRMWALMLT